MQNLSSLESSDAMRDRVFDRGLLECCAEEEVKKMNKSIGLRDESIESGLSVICVEDDVLSYE